MTASQVIEEIKRLPPEEQRKVFEFTRSESRRLTPEELGRLADEMANTQDPKRASELKEEIVRGFYGSEPHA
jgi:hypothetical protein